MVFIKLTYCTTYLTAVWQLYYPLCGHAIKAQCVYAAPALYTKQRRTRKQQQQEGQQGWQGRLTHHPKKVKVPNEMKAHLLFGLGSSVMDNMMIGCNYYAWAAGQESIRSSYLYNTYISDREKKWSLALQSSGQPNWTGLPNLPNWFGIWFDIYLKYRTGPFRQN